MSKRKRKYSPIEDMVSTGVGSLVGIGMIGPTATMANALPAGTARTITQIVPGLQATSVMGVNLGLAKRSLKSKDNYW